ncbi:class I SAM-dependent methyltransferase [Chitinophagaceae bacterium MMS25-I14]
MKQKLAGILRALGLIYVADLARYKYIALQNRSRNNAFVQRNPGVALPPPYMIYETFRLDYERYFEKGKASAEWIREEISPFMELKNRDILDWGCGPGRVIRHMPQVINNGCRFFGSDYNPDYVKWCSANLPGISFSKNELNPPLTYNDASFDLIYVISIFTHLSEESHRQWFTELMRVMKPGGILFMTTHGNITRRNLMPDELAKYDSGQLVVRAHVKEGHRMYAAYQPESYMHHLFDGKVDILKHKPGTPQSWGLEQDLWIVRKK